MPELAELETHKPDLLDDPHAPSQSRTALGCNYVSVVILDTLGPRGEIMYGLRNNEKQGAWTETEAHSKRSADRGCLIGPPPLLWLVTNAKMKHFVTYLYEALESELKLAAADNSDGNHWAVL
ncbi:hypothetical protein L209DRAFT_36305 [Thermothelomyces heterothallicus CBS 203.75]